MSVSGAFEDLKRALEASLPWISEQPFETAKRLGAVLFGWILHRSASA